jgi:signal transduction histidine kinase
MLESQATIAGGDASTDDVSRLVAAVGHDLRHLVGALSHQIELLSGDDLDSRLRQRCLHSIVETGAELERFVDGLADLERTLRGEHSVRLQHVDLRTMIRTVMVDRSQLGGDLAGVDAPASAVCVDPTIARRVLQILVAECEAMSDAVTVELSTSVDTVEVVISGGSRRATADPNDVRPISETDGLAPWIASRLGRVSGIDVVIDPISLSFLVRLPSAPLVHD